MIKLVIFDLDGTLVNSVDDLADSVNRALAENGYPTHTISSYYHFVGNGVKKLIERALPQGTPESELERIFDIFSRYYNDGCLNKTAPYDGIVTLISELKSMGISCAVASNKPDTFSKRIVSALFGDKAFDYIRGKTDTAKAKPAPDIIFEILDALEADAKNTILAGDSDVDVHTAHNAEIKCIGCEWGFRGRAELEAAGADFIAAEPLEILELIKSININR